ncbi:MAG TPA: esterase-like activity of phytase family protein, partial [Chromatiales bacterium]|nr:esterase-like activity of phytase family protein [Chromatiales bacterium]
IVSWFELGGQPDAVAVSPNQRYAAIAIENERDEDLGNGEPPQAPAGYLTIVDLVGEPANWNLRQVSFDGVPGLFSDDAEPEYVAINEWNIAAVTLQENNHIALVHLPTGRIVNDFSAGTVDLEQVDNNENDLIELTASLSDIPREPDGITWISPLTMATADEGDLFGGSRGFSIFDLRGNVLYRAGNSLEHAVVRLGHYPEDRSENKGNEPENVTFGRFGKDRLLFVASERASLIFVYKLDRFGKRPQMLQVLPATVGPEGILAIPQRDLLIAAGEEDARGDGIRGSLTIYQRTGNNTYPTVHSADRADGTPIPWAALSGLALHPQDARTAYTIHDSFYQQSRIYKMDIPKSPAQITDEIVLRDASGVLRAVAPHMVNDDNTVNLDPEGIATRADGGFWIASEGNGTVGDPARPVRTLNLLLHVSDSGVIDEVVTLPASTNARQVRFGYEGVVSVGRGSTEKVYVAIQREWADDPARHVRIGEYETATGNWRFFYYPLDARESPNGGWVGLSEITALDDTTFAVVERDNQANTDARIKRIYRFSIDGLPRWPIRLRAPHRLSRC